ncbi:gamma-interferon-inducible lysosomal thiol reductase isoform X2 [Halyomorpha halys]|uniref:gamma-interferon-inducible lysosomal thiol reductase isoform X2 n=1 Tax=Halyomorpha halys TaxID=286706 RepID=UPI0006D4D255|nr:gamma-interferon-inducible lysosomal thiol reductase [Halyomorpha halys]
MLIVYGLLSLAASVTSTTLYQNTTAQVAVTLYYETLCPFSLNFITDELSPTFLDSQYGSLIKELNLIPFGIAIAVNSTAHDYVCQHDEAECQGNRFHACAIKHIQDKKSLVKYLKCLAETVEVDSEEEEDYPVDQCLDKIPDGLYPKIMGCYNSEEGWKLMEENGRRTENFFNSSGEEFVPYVSFDNGKNDDLAMEAISNLKKTISQLSVVKYSASIETSEESEEEEEEV